MKPASRVGVNANQVAALKGLKFIYNIFVAGQALPAECKRF